MTEPMDFNEVRKARAMSERRFYLGPFTFKRRPSVPPEVLAAYSRAGQDGDDAATVEVFEQTLLDLTEDQAEVTETGLPISTAEAWRQLRFEGDAYDVVSFFDLADILKWLVEGIAERPTGLPSDSPDGSSTPPGGTNSTDTRPPAALTSVPSMPAAS